MLLMVLSSTIMALSPTVSESTLLNLIILYKLSTNSAQQQLVATEYIPVNTMLQLFVRQNVRCRQLVISPPHLHGSQRLRAL